MVSIKQQLIHLDNGEIDLDAWFDRLRNHYHLKNTELIEKSTHFANEIARGLTTFYGQPCLEHGLGIAEIILTLKLDQEAVASGILIGVLQNTKITSEIIEEKIHPNVAKIIKSVQQMDAIHNIQKNAEKARDQIQIDRFRKLILAMVSDIRVVLIKLAERTNIMRGIKNINPLERQHIAQETMDIYAPLANRLGIGQLKWELEDVAFHYIDPDTYKTIAKFLAERRVDREKNIHDIIARLSEKLHEANINAEISGRAKHIYSIFLKAQRKKTSYQGIYDYSAIRLLVPTIQDCYTALSIVHNLWEHVPHEFDDYISSPKPNGYRSIHTAVIGPDNKTFEIQIRTYEMHEEAERGVAAHWVYKEGKSKSDYESKIVFLRQLLDWHQDVANQEEKINPAFDEILTDRIYVFTPAGDILDLPAGATPLDCAYQIHSDVGNKCKGSKINGHIVPLTYKLKTGDQIEILTNPNGTPSRDWLNAEFGYVTTPRARSKISHWFRQQDLNQHIESGRRVLEKEFSRNQPNIQKLTHHFHFKDEDSFLAAIGRGNIRPSQIAHFVESQHETNKTQLNLSLTKKSESKATGMNIAGISDLMTRIARCCKPIPGDSIIGFITQGRGVTIHKRTCSNMRQITLQDNNNRLIEISWDKEHKGAYYVDLQIKAHVRENLLKEVTTVLANAKINLVNFNSTVNRSNLQIVTLTVQIHALSQLNELTNQLNHLRGVIEINRVTY